MRVIVVTFWKLRQTRVFNDLYPDLADNWIDDMREEHGSDALDFTREYGPVRNAPELT